MLDRAAVVGVGERIEAGIFAEAVRAGLDQRDRGDELVLVVEVARVQDHRTLVEIVRQGRGQLTTLIGLEAGRAHAVGGAPETADAAVPTLGDLEAGETIQTVQTFIAIGHADAAGRLFGAGLKEEVGGGTHLAVGEYHRRTALQDFDRLDGVVEAHQRGGFKERQRGHAVHRRAHQQGGEVRRIAAAGEAGDLDVGAGLAAGGFRPHAGRDLQQIGRALGVGLFDLLGIGGDDVVAGFDFLDAAGRAAGDDHRVQRGGFLLAGRRCGRLLGRHSLCRGLLCRSGFLGVGQGRRQGCGDGYGQCVTDQCRLLHGYSLHSCLDRLVADPSRLCGLVRSG